VVKVDRRIRWHYTTTILRFRIGARLTGYRNCKFHNFARTISRHADGIRRYSVPPSAGPLLPLPVTPPPRRLCVNHQGTLDTVTVYDANAPHRNCFIYSLIIISIFLACYHVAKNEGKKFCPLWGPLFGWTCWTCLNPPLWVTSSRSVLDTVGVPGCVQNR